MNKKMNTKMGNFKCVVVSFCLMALVAGGAARMGAVAGDYIVAVQAAQQAEEDSMYGVAGTYYGFVNNRPATLNLLESQRFTASMKGAEGQTCKLAGQYSVVDGTLNLQDEESGREFVLAFDGENASMDAGEASIRFSADPSRAAAGMFPVAYPVSFKEALPPFLFFKKFSIL